MIEVIIISIFVIFIIASIHFDAIFYKKCDEIEKKLQN